MIISLKENLTLDTSNIIKIIASDKLANFEFQKTIIRPIILKSKNYFQFERFKDNKVFHKNVEEKDLKDVFMLEIVPNYAQIVFYYEGKTVSYIKQKSGKIKIKTVENTLKMPNAPLSNNKEKQYVLKEGEDIPALVDLGVFTKENKIVSSKYDKYKQINRFIELIDDEFKNSTQKEITILDFGCGKSYLTFIVYYYFVKVKKMNAKIIGYDLKEDVVENCNKIAQKYGYSNLEFIVADVKKDKLYDNNIDAVISLHACDTATDYALNFAITHNVKHIFSVPCCQHEINLSIKQGGELDFLLKYGIIKERVCALMTDSIRAMILEDLGYSVDLIEFVDLSHSPKNIMIRATKCKKPS
ncbi:MAG: SAM-dependent methyltransferase, partial [Clostridia bacterium]|nr:SAM-dependent methyltransferase [Clostridia bacterium]